MTKQNYKVDENNRTIVANIATLSKEEKEEIQFLCSMGYTFKQAQPKKTRKSATKKMAYYKTLLYAADYKRFEELCSVDGLSYSKACSWANALVAMGQANDNDSVEKMRGLIDDFFANGERLVDCFIFADAWKKAHKPAKKQRKALSDADKLELGIEDELAA